MQRSSYTLSLHSAAALSLKSHAGADLCPSPPPPALTGFCRPGQCETLPSMGSRRGFCLGAALALVLAAGTAHAARNCGVGEARSRGGCVCALGYGTDSAKPPCK